MKYAVISSILLLISFGIGFVAARLLRKRLPVKRKKLLSFLITVFVGLGLTCTAGVIYLNADMPAQEAAAASLQGSEAVTVTKVDGGYFFDGPAADKAIIFYPGAKVEYTAYAPLAEAFSEAGFDCFLTEMPLNFAFLGANAADTFISNYSYNTWIMAGHSMGGTVAATYAQKHPDTVKGLVLLASYSTVPVGDGIKVLSLYGSEDGCLEKDVYEEYKANWPADATESVIQGGNHAAFGDYGVQKGDNEATLTAPEQWRITAASVASCFAD